MFITKEKLHFSLTCSFYCCLVQVTWALQVAERFAVRGLVAFKPVVFKKVYSDVLISATILADGQSIFLKNYMDLFLILA